MDIQNDPDSTWSFPSGPQMTIWESLLHPSITPLDSRICLCFSAFIAFKCLYAFFTPVLYGKFNPGLTPTSRFALTGQQATIIMNLPCIIVPAILLAITDVFHFSRNLKNEFAVDRISNSERMGCYCFIRWKLFPQNFHLRLLKNEK
jgi:hypothetical protein